MLWFPEIMVWLLGLWSVVTGASRCHNTVVNLAPSSFSTIYSRLKTHAAMGCKEACMIMFAFLQIPQLPADRGQRRFYTSYTCVLRISTFFKSKFASHREDARLSYCDILRTFKVITRNFACIHAGKVCIPHIDFAQ